MRGLVIIAIIFALAGCTSPSQKGGPGSTMTQDSFRPGRESSGTGDSGAGVPGWCGRLGALLWQSDAKRDGAKTGDNDAPVPVRVSAPAGSRGGPSGVVQAPERGMTMGAGTLILCVLAGVLVADIIKLALSAFWNFLSGHVKWIPTNGKDVK